MRPAWGAWVKVVTQYIILFYIVRCAPHGAHGLRWRILKIDGIRFKEMRPAWGAWVKVPIRLFWVPAIPMMRPAWGAWVTV